MSAAVTAPGGGERAGRAVGRRRLRAVLDPVVNLGGPALVFVLLRPELGEVPALLLSGMPPLLWSAAAVWRERRLDALAVLALGGIALSVLLLVGGGSGRMLLLREKLATLVIGLLFLGSAAAGRPVIRPIARAMEARRSAEALEAFDARCGLPEVRRTLAVMTLVWGAGLVAEFAVSAALLFMLPMAAAVSVGPVLGYAALGGLGAWTAWYRRRSAGAA